MLVRLGSGPLVRNAKEKLQGKADRTIIGTKSENSGAELLIVETDSYEIISGSIPVVLHHFFDSNIESTRLGQG